MGVRRRGERERERERRASIASAAFRDDPREKTLLRDFALCSPASSLFALCSAAAAQPPCSRCARTQSGNFGPSKRGKVCPQHRAAARKKERDAPKHRAGTALSGQRSHRAATAQHSSFHRAALTITPHSHRVASRCHHAARAISTHSHRAARVMSPRSTRDITAQHARCRRAALAISPRSTRD